MPPSPSTAKPWSISCQHCTVSPQGAVWGLGVFLGGQHPGGVQLLAHSPRVWSFSPLDESDARRKEAIRAKVSQNTDGFGWVWVVSGGWGQHLHPLHPVSGVSSPPRCAQVRQYISRAEELKVLVTSSNKNLLEKGNPARELLKGSDFCPSPSVGAGRGRGGVLG